MGLFDRFKPKPHPLVTWLEEQGRQAHGRKLTFNDEKYNDGSRRLYVGLEGRQAEFDALQFNRPERYLDAAQTAALPSIHDGDWRRRMEGDDIPQGIHVGGGFVLDPDFNPGSPVVARHGARLGGYLERFSRCVDGIAYEMPRLTLEVARDRATPPELRRDIECAHELLSLLEQA